jgi:ABC-type nitrate/sulfonate/bicarbonate transport system permease component
MFNPHKPLSPTTKKLLGAGALILLLIVWTFVSTLVGQNKLPSPLSVLNAFSYLAWDNGQSQLLGATIASVSRVAIATLFVLLIGIPVGVLMGAAPPVNAALSPLLDPFRSAPIVAILPILVIWLGIGEEMKVTFLFLGAVIFMIPMVRDAIKAVPYIYWESARDLGASYYECITRAVLPMAMPRIAEAGIMAVSIQWGYITVAEYVNATQGLGSLIQSARRFSAMDQVFAGIIVIILIAFITDIVLKLIKNKYYFWAGK